jgi:hypothetical protein
MSAIHVAPQERIAALKRFGYSEPEASFVALAALHSGYFLRRQFARFAACRDGGSVTQFVCRALALAHARSSRWRQNAQVYHLCARPLYHALGEPDNRNRRQHQWPQIKNKVMGLDFVLAHPDAQYLATEREKVDHFTSELRIDRDTLPAKRFRSATDRSFTTRYFVEKYPVFIHGSESGERGSWVAFCFVDEGQATLSRFESFLALHRPLFQALARFQLIYVADTDAHFAAARSMFERFRTRAVFEPATGTAAHVDEILDYFRLRSLYENRDFSTFDRSQLIRLRNARSALSNAETEALYLTWRASGDDVLRQHLGAKPPISAPIGGTFSTEFLGHDYGLFGHFPCP